jgi:hypothetical protein
MNRALALACARRLCHGLETTDVSAHRLLERISSDADAEALRAALVDLGARQLLEEHACACEHCYPRSRR